MESFIRSKYESRRWAREGPPPSDPSTLDDGSAAQQQQQQQQVPPAITPPPANGGSRSTHATSGSISSTRGQPVTNRQPQPHQLLSTTVANRTTQPAVAAAHPQVQQTQAQPAQAPAQATPANDLFTLDFHNPTPQANNAAAQPKKDVKQDIMSLFSTSAPAAPQQVPGFGGAQAAFGQFGGVPPQMQMQMQAQQNAWGGQFGAAQGVPQQQPTSMMGNAGVGMWGAASGWNAAPAGMQPQANMWGAQPQAQALQQQSQMGGMFNTNDVWGTPAAAPGGDQAFGGFVSQAPQKKDDAFGDLWGGFK